MGKSLFSSPDPRLDVFLSKRLNQSRSHVSDLIKKGCVSVNGKKITKSGFKVDMNSQIDIDFPEIKQTQVNKEVDFDVEKIYEDDDILVINKPSGVVVHDAPSVKKATLVDWLKKQGISLSTISGEERHGIVHRLDKDTSGIMVIAKNNTAHQNLSNQLSKREMGRYYIAIIDMPLKEDMIINAPIARNPKNRLKMAIVEGGRESKSAFCKLFLSKDQKKELITAKLFSGRTHQIRVHLSHINRHIVGDKLYGSKENVSRVFLHAFILYLRHPKSGKEMLFLADLTSDFKELLDRYFSKEVYEKISKDYILSCCNRFV